MAFIPMALRIQQEPMRSEVEKLISNHNPPTVVKITDVPANSLTYQNMKYLRRAAHVGQFKLELSEIQFLTECAEITPTDKQIYVVYAGSGPGHSRQNLADMFPTMKFILIDPQEHIIKGCAGCNGPRKHEPRSKLYFRKSNKTTIGNEIIDFATKDAGIIQCEKNSDISDDRLLDPEEIAATILREKSYTFYIIEDLFDNAHAHAFARLGTVLFISDIRTNISNPEMTQRHKYTKNIVSDDAFEESPSDMDIIINNIWQHTWVYIMQPLRCMLKFRTPFMNEYDIRAVHEKSGNFADTLREYNATFKTDILHEYESGRYVFMANDHINLQAFAGQSSSETRLIASTQHYNKLVIYDPHDYENKMFYYNLMREFCFYGQNATYFNATVGLDGCADCNLALHIINEYIRVSRKLATPITFTRPDEFIKASLARMSRTLRTEIHGNIRTPLSSIADVAKALEARSTRSKIMPLQRASYLKKKERP